MTFYDKMFTDTDKVCYDIERNKIGVCDNTLICYEISTISGDIIHIKVFEEEKLIDEALFIYNQETEDYDEFTIQ